MAAPKVILKIEQIARLRVAGNLPDGKIADMFGMSQGGLSRILATQEYKDAEASVLANTVSKLDEALAGRADEIRQTYAVAVPAAARTLLDAVLQRRDLKAAISAATEILDRDPLRTLSKITNRSEAQAQPAPPPEAILASIAADAAKVATEVAKGVVDAKKVN